jgi:hypothetical protein
MHTPYKSGVFQRVACGPHETSRCILCERHAFVAKHVSFCMLKNNDLILETAFVDVISIWQQVACLCYKMHSSIKKA